MCIRDRLQCQSISCRLCQVIHADRARIAFSGRLGTRYAIRILEDVSSHLSHAGHPWTVCGRGRNVPSECTQQRYVRLFTDTLQRLYCMYCHPMKTPPFHSHIVLQPRVQQNGASSTALWLVERWVRHVRMYQSVYLYVVIFTIRRRGFPGPFIHPPHLHGRCNSSTKRPYGVFSPK